MLSGGTIYDPSNNIHGTVADLWIENGKIIAAPDDDESASFRRVDLAGRIVMPGAIDMHCHIAGPKVNIARKMQPEEARKTMPGHRPDLPMSSVPDIFTTGLRYTGLGYTTCFDAAISPLAAKQVHHEFDVIPNIDTGFFVLVGNNHYAMRSIQKKNLDDLKAFLGWALNFTGGYAPKLVNPGGVEMWKQRAGGNARDLDEMVAGFDVTPRQIMDSITSAANELNLPHPVHIHCNNLGIPGNFSTTLETMKTVAGRRAHLTHIQFHSYGGGDADESRLTSRVQPLADFINAHPELTVDVGQIMFDRTTSMTADGPLAYYLQSIGNEKWYSADIELESGCGISPIEYRDKNFIHALQWAIGLEWYLSVDDPWQIVLSSDHPNGCSFLAYPKIIRLLMDREHRREQLKRVHPRVAQSSPLKDFDREFSLSDIAVITRAGPARILGLKNKGHLGVGADADISVYTPDVNFETMFSWPYMVIKNGNILIENGELREEQQGMTHAACPEYDRDRGQGVESWFEREYSIPLHPIRITTS